MTRVPLVARMPRSRSAVCTLRTAARTALLSVLANEVVSKNENGYWAVLPEGVHNLTGVPPTRVIPTAIQALPPTDGTYR